MWRPFQVVFGSVFVVLLIAGPVAYAFQQRAQMRNFRVVREGVLYRSGQMTTAGLKRVVHDYGIRTVVTLRDSIDGPAGAADRAEEEFCAREELYYLRLSPRSWDLVNGKAPVDENVRQYVSVIEDKSKYPVLVHCMAGIHRTGAYCAIYRMAKEGWDNDRAIAEVKACGYDTLDGELDILGYLDSYRPKKAIGVDLPKSATPR